MGAAEEAVDAAANFIGPYLNRNTANKAADIKTTEEQGVEGLVEQALSHLQKINEAEQTKAPDAPYDGSLVGVVYGLLDLVTSLGILPYLSPGVAFYQRPQSVLVASLSLPPTRDDRALARVVEELIPIFEQNGLGVQPLLAQRILPDVFAALTELVHSPNVHPQHSSKFMPQYGKLLSSTPTSRLLPILSSYLQQHVPTWMRQIIAKELALLPLRPNGVRSTIEFLALSSLSKNGQVPENASGSQSQIAIPLEAINQSSRLLAAVPTGMLPEAWYQGLAPQLLALLDGSAGVELARAAGQVIAGGILNRKSTGAPGTIGWEMFARPILETIKPGFLASSSVQQGSSSEVFVEEHNLKMALQRLSTMIAAVSHSGVIKRLVHPLLLPLWALLVYIKSRPSLDPQWAAIVRKILVRYMSIACDPKQIDQVVTQLFWDGEDTWTFGPGSHGGVEIRRRTLQQDGMAGTGRLLAKIEQLDGRIRLLVDLLDHANMEDETISVIFLQTMQRWLSTDKSQQSKTSLAIGVDGDPIAALADAKLSEAMATKFQGKFARSPQHIIALIGYILQNFVHEHQMKAIKVAGSTKPSRANLGSLVAPKSEQTGGAVVESEDLVSFALSILSTLIDESNQASTSTSASTSSMWEHYSSILPSLRYLADAYLRPPLSPLITNAASNLLNTLQPTTSTSFSSTNTDMHTEHRKTFQTALTDITSPEPPNRTWALSTLHKLLQDPIAFPLIDIPKTTHLLLSTSLSDPESYVHTAAIPVLVTLTTLAPNPTLRILLDAFIDINEDSLRLRKALGRKQTEDKAAEKEKELEQSLDFRLRVAEVLHQLLTSSTLFSAHKASSSSSHYTNLSSILTAGLTLASRRGQRPTTQQTRSSIATLESATQAEAEEAWGGPIPNLLDPDSENAGEAADRDALYKIVSGWADTGVEEDVRIRASALSIVGDVYEHCLGMLSQRDVDAGLQIVLQVLVVERDEVKAILRRAAVLVVIGLLRGLDAELEDSGNRSGSWGVAGLSVENASEVERVIWWVVDEDQDEMVRGHARAVVEGLENWRLKMVYRAGEGQIKLDKNLNPDMSEGLRGLDVKPNLTADGNGRKKMVIEEIE